MSAHDRDLHADAGAAAIEVADSFAAAIEVMPSILEEHEKPTIPEAIMLCAYALMYQREMHRFGIDDALANLQESIDFIAAKPDANEAPTDHERRLIYRSLKADYLDNGDPEKIQDMGKALARFKRIAGI